jgi:amino acid permease
MLTNSLMPYAFEKGGAMAGVFTVVGFAVSMLGS